MNTLTSNNNPTNMDSVIMQLTRNEISHELDIAAEMFIVKNYTAIHYKDLMQELQEGEVTSRQLVKWLKDHNSKATEKRKASHRDGIITRYKKDCQEHFEDGYWCARYLPDMMRYVKELSTTSSYCSSSKDFIRSFTSYTWIIQATAITGLTMMEDMFGNGCIKSPTAEILVGSLINERNNLAKLAKIFGKQLKQHEYNPEDIHSVIVDMFKESRKVMQQQIANIYSPEFQTYTKYKGIITDMLKQIPATQLTLLAEGGQS